MRESMIRAAFLLMTTLACADDTSMWQQLPPLPASLGVAGAFAGISGDALLVAGGANFPAKMPWEGGKKVWTDQVWVLDQPRGEWKPAGKLTHPLAYGVSASSQDEVICAGGSDEQRHFAEGFRLRWHAGKLTQTPLASLPIPLAGAAGALVGRTWYVAGGSTKPGEQAASRRCFALSVDTPDAEWKELPPWPGEARVLAVAAAWKGRFLIFGGAALKADGTGKVVRRYLRDAWSYHPEEGWRQLADLPKPCVAAPSPAPAVGGKIWLLAGDDGSRVNFQPLADHPGFPAVILAYDADANRWSEAGAVPAPRATTPVVEWRGRSVIPSGEVRPGVRSPEVWTLTPR